MRIFVDIDGTIAKTQGSDYPNSQPIPEAIAKVNTFYDWGDTIVYWTARGQNSGVDWTDLTTRQLHEWGCKYHELRLDKPSFDLMIDDKAKPNTFLLDK
jgi:CMP-N,N'-diacetyllegionaminic acid synthase